MPKNWIRYLPHPVFNPRLALKTLKKSLVKEIPYDLMRIFGLFGLIHTPLIYIIDTNHPGIRSVETGLRLINFLLFIPLVFNQQWPTAYHRFKKYYWFASITFVLPFFATFMFILNNGNRAWFTKITIALLWMVLITNWSVFLLSLITGIMAGIITYGALIDPSFSGFSLSWPELFNSFWIVIIAGFFSLKRDEIAQNRLNSMRSLAHVVAHEMRTPLFGIRSATMYMGKNLDILINRYSQARNGQLNPEDQDLIDKLLKTPKKIDKITKDTFSTIDMLLINLNEVKDSLSCQTLSINDLVDSALEGYPSTEKEKDLIRFNRTNDQIVYGNKDQLRHVLFNLIKNALFHIKESRKGRIYISAENHGDKALLIFKDTGEGIPQKALPFIFEPYYSSTKYGTGTGLNFCKQAVEACGGTISCHSIEKKETIFRIELQKANDSTSSNTIQPPATQL